MNQKHILDKIASMKPRRTIEAYTTKNKPDIAIAIGNIVVADDAISGDCVNLIKKNANNTVEGSPPIKPPVLLPNRSPARIVKYIQQLPIRNVNNNCRKK